MQLTLSPSTRQMPRLVPTYTGSLYNWLANTWVSIGQSVTKCVTQIAQIRQPTSP